MWSTFAFSWAALLKSGLLSQPQGLLNHGSGLSSRVCSKRKEGKLYKDEEFRDGLTKKCRQRERRGKGHRKNKEGGMKERGVSTERGIDFLLAKSNC